jgi:Fic family protein
MVIVVKERKGNHDFYYLKHHSGTKTLKKYLGKFIPKDIQQQKEQFLQKFYHLEWDDKIKEIAKKYQKEIKSLPLSVQIQNFESFGISFTYNTQRIEGSTLTHEDTKDLLIHGITPNKKSKIDTIETQRHYDLFIKLVSSKKLQKLTLDVILSWHNEIFGQTKIGEAGSIRTGIVGISGNDKIEFATVPQIKPQLVKLFESINKYDGKMTPVEFACRIHYDFVSIHPFWDGNGRLSRLLMNYILFKHDHPLMLIQNINKKAYFKSLERSQLENNSIHFLKWFMKYYIKSNKKYL